MIKKWSEHSSRVSLGMANEHFFVFSAMNDFNKRPFFLFKKRMFSSARGWKNIFPQILTQIVGILVQLIEAGSIDVVVVFIDVVLRNLAVKRNKDK